MSTKLRGKEDIFLISSGIDADHFTTMDEVVSGIINR